MTAPPCSGSPTGRPLAELMDIYKQYLLQPLRNHILIADGIWKSQVSNLSLEEYVEVHNVRSIVQNFIKVIAIIVKHLVQAAKMVIDNGYCNLSNVFRTVFPNCMYQSTEAKRRLLRLPLVAIRMGNNLSGHSCILLTENLPCIDYVKLQKMLQPLSTNAGAKVLSEKSEYRQLMRFCQSRREREILTYAVQKSSGLTSTAMRRHYGICNVSQHSFEVEEVLEEFQTICESVQELASVQLQAVTGEFSSEDSEWQLMFTFPL